MAQSTRRMSINAEADRTLDHVGNVSGYISALVTDRARTWQEALECLRFSGWESPEILAALDAVWSLWITPTMNLGEQFAAGMEDADLSQRDIAPKMWKKFTRQTREQEPTARALRDLLAEMRAGNAALQARLIR